MIWLKTKFLLLSCLILLSGFAFSCKSTVNQNNDNSGLFDFSSDTEKAVEHIRQANDELKRIKILYNENQNVLQQLKEAAKNKESEKVKTISDVLIYAINDGFVFADSAKSKIKEAQALNITQDYKDYLGMKEQSLTMQTEAFQFLYDAAKLLRDTAGSQDKDQIEKSRLVFKEKEENFQKKMGEAKKISLQADDLAKESMQRSK